MGSVRFWTSICVKHLDTKGLSIGPSTTKTLQTSLWAFIASDWSAAGLAAFAIALCCSAIWALQLNFFIVSAFPVNIVAFPAGWPGAVTEILERALGFHKSICQGRAETLRRGSYETLLQVTNWLQKYCTTCSLFSWQHVLHGRQSSHPIAAAMFCTDYTWIRKWRNLLVTFPSKSELAVEQVKAIWHRTTFESDLVHASHKTKVRRIALILNKKKALFFRKRNRVTAKYVYDTYIHTYTYTATILQGIEPTSYHLPTENILEKKNMKWINFQNSHVNRCVANAGQYLDENFCLQLG